MKIRILLLFILVFNLTEGKTRIFTIGDSTMADYDTLKYSGAKEQRGWCQMFPMFLSKDITLKNAAKNGRGSKTFYKEVWVNLRNELKPGDVVFIQFGHNDEKQNGLDTDEKDSTARGTAPWGLFQKYLKLYVKETREKGAMPVLFTPVVRRYFIGNVLTQKAQHNLSEVVGDSTLNYVAAMKSVARELNVPIIDLTASTKKLVERYGSEKSKTVLYVNSDDTHLKKEGAYQFAKLAANELREKHIIFK
ncbi:MAG: rhamnogalacturonan acetylesterase [Paludibacter sp.]